MPENNMGALVWQLNTPWTTLALNKIEYTGRWKFAQYVTKQAYEQVVASSWFEPTNETYSIWVASDSWEATKGIITTSWYNWDGEVLSSETYDYSLDPLESSEVVSFTGWQNILPPLSSIEKSVLNINLEAQETCSGRQYQSRNHWVPDYLSSSSISDPGLEIEFVGNLEWRVEATRGVAAYVWLTEPAGIIGYFNDN